ncbi:hypothetical protein KY284_024595 [Solanum tuberosum]|nr:hypothetical protein KY284_024595 [Solanum tuberosum]
MCSSGRLKVMLVVFRRTKEHMVHQFLKMLLQFIGAFCNYHQALSVAGVEFQITFISELELGGKREDMYVHL